MTARWSFGLLLTLTACTDSVSVTDFPYGAGQPGLKLREGGEIRHENVRFLGTEQTWVMVYQYTAPPTVATAPFAAPADGGKGEWGNCVDERNGAPTWPFTAITGATYLTLSKVQLSGPGITGALDIAKTDPPNKAGNSTFRTYDFTYGGGAPNAKVGFNATKTTPAMAQAGADYTLDIGKGAPMTYHMPSGYQTPLGIGGAADIKIPKNQDLTLMWTPPVNDRGASGNEHLKTTYFNFTLFADPTSATNPPQFICFPDVDGHQVIPAAVINAIPTSGLIVNADLSHYMESREAAAGEQRRFDLVSIYCNISTYTKQ
jgi:hypothetical protein